VRYKKWADVLTIVSGKNQKAVVNPEGRYPIYGSGGVIGHADDYLCEAGTTVVGRKGTINSPIFVSERFWNVDTAFGITPGEELNPKYLYYFCESFNFKALDKSTTIPSLAKRDLLGIEMPVPPLEEQKHVVARIEDLFSELDNGVETLKKTKRQLAVYRQAVLEDAFSHITEKKPIREVTSVVTSGSRGWAQYYSNHGTKFVRIGNLTRDRICIDLSDIQYVDLPDGAEGKRTQLQPNDVLVSITADLGSIGLVPDDIGESYVNQHIAMIRFNNSAQGELMAWYLRSDYGQKDLLKNKRGGGKLGLGLDDIRDSRVPVVCDAEALRIVENIEARLSVCDSIEKTVDTALQQAEAMRQSILKKTFEGRL